MSDRYGIPAGRVVTLAEFPDLLNETFGLLGDARVLPRTPYVWWDRHLHGRDPETTRGQLARPMPEPVAFIGGHRAKRRRQPLFNAVEVVTWYRHWKRIAVRPRNAAAQARQKARRLELERELKSAPSLEAWSTR